MTSVQYILLVSVMSMPVNRLKEIANSWMGLRIKKKGYINFNPNPLYITKWHVRQTVCHHK